MPPGRRPMSEIRSISAVTLATSDMGRAVRFYSALGFRIRYGGETAAFTSFNVGQGWLNLSTAPDLGSSSGGVRVIFYVDDVDSAPRRHGGVSSGDRGTA